jgi:hypothetical protein
VHLVAADTEHVARFGRSRLSSVSVHEKGPSPVSVSVTPCCAGIEDVLVAVELGDGDP